ncbi:MAG TPA: hypothetical protein VNW97_14445 [Candidatus Saccharimonadales bacterium]|jgi:hypothetical protein|nr:hypothetical protein [Candidatus Saccharimonadales bacterium]
MANHFTAETVYFLQEGKTNLSECLEVAFRSAVHYKIKKLVIFTSEGLGVRKSVEEFLPLEKFREIKIIAVTFPAGKKFKDKDNRIFAAGISDSDRALFQSQNIPVLRAHLPFDSVQATWKHHGVLGQDLSLVGDALCMFGGSMSLCVQAVAIACDSGEVAEGEHVIALTSDTAILAQSAPTTRILCDLVIREILCKPAIYSIGRGESASQLKMELDTKKLDGSTADALPPGPAPVIVEPK